MRDVPGYVGLIAPEHSDKPKFVQEVSLRVAPLALLQSMTLGLVQDYDLDFSVGKQLDAVGRWVGRSRELQYPIEGAFFSFDDPARGLDKAVWKQPYDTNTGIYVLDDDTYRRLLKTLIALNYSDGTVPSIQAALDIYFTDTETKVFVVDEGFTYAAPFFSFDDPLRGLDDAYWQRPGDLIDSQALSMAMTVGFAQKIPSSVDLGLLAQNVFPIKPQGVSLTYAVTSVIDTPLFGFDVENEFVGGLDSGAWGVDPQTAIDSSLESLDNLGS
jgi:hypothetical protein